MKRKKRIRVHSVRTETDADIDLLINKLFEEAAISETSDMSLKFGGHDKEPFKIEINGKAPEKSEITEVTADAWLTVNDEKISVSYRESEMNGMSGSRTTLVFTPDTPGLVSLLRDGDYSTALVFEEGRRHTCVYNTLFGAFDLCVYTRRVENKLLSDGVLILDYIIEIKGADAEYNLLTITLTDIT